jgi:hypothetical protein
MTDNGIDLWPTDLLDQVDTIRTPLAILREQAELLGKKSNNLVEAKVKTNQKKPEMYVVPTLDIPSITAFNMLKGKTVNPDREAAETNATLVQSFYLVASVLNYQYQLFYVTHPIQCYPLTVYFENQTMRAESEEEFITILKGIFASEKTKRIIEALIAQSVA